ncbi:MAG: helix-turn-helix domain-containing protein [Propionibacteriaceae bacterium]|jgi:hypothetical protein|nr:helix-turn-helix domain-containing protein [Propionibacteriaceae bacterium]
MAGQWVLDGTATVRQVLALGPLLPAKLLAGEAALDRPVSKVRPLPRRREASGEYRDTAIVADGADFAENDYLIDLALRWMGEEGAPLLVLVSGQLSPSVSPRRLADRLGVALATVDGSLLEVIDVVRESVEAPNRQVAQVVVELADRLERLGKDQGIDKVLALVDAALGATSVLVDGDGQAVVGPVLQPPVTSQALQGQPVYDSRREFARLTSPIWVAGEHARYWLVIQLPSPTPAGRQAITRVAQLAGGQVAVRLASELLRRERQSRAAFGVLETILSLADVPDAALLRQIDALGWRVDGWCGAVQVRAEDADPATVMSWTQPLRARLTEAGLRGPLVERPDGWVWWETRDLAREPADVDTLANRWRSALAGFQSARPGLRMQVGLGCAYPHLEGLRKSLSEAADAALIAQTDGGELTLRYYGDLGIQRLLARFITTAEFLDFAGILLRPVLESRHSGELLETLEAFLDCESSVTSTAEALDLHRNTVMRRVARLKELLGAELDDPDGRLALQLACRVVNLNT